MSIVTIPAEHVEVSIPNPSIVSDKWFFTDAQEENLGKCITLLGLLIAVLVSAFGANAVIPLMDPTLGPWIAGVAALALVGAAVYFLPSVARKAIEAREHKRDTYRAHYACEIVDSLRDAGWKIHKTNPVEAIIKDNSHYLLDENDVCYYSQNFYISKDTIFLNLTLSDTQASAKAKEHAQNARIDFLIKQYEEANGPLTTIEMPVFIAALRMVI